MLVNIVATKNQGYALVSQIQTRKVVLKVTELQLHFNKTSGL